MRQAMKTGDEKYLPARDQGPGASASSATSSTAGSRFVELMIPLLLVTTVMAWSGNAALAVVRQRAAVRPCCCVIVVDMLLLRFRLRRELATRFPDEPTKGTTYYAVTRSLQMKFMRLPKPQVKIGQELPEHYR